MPFFLNYIGYTLFMDENSNIEGIFKLSYIKARNASLTLVHPNHPKNATPLSRSCVWQSIEHVNALPWWGQTIWSHLTFSNHESNPDMLHLVDGWFVPCVHLAGYRVTCIEISLIRITFKNILCMTSLRGIKFTNYPSRPLVGFKDSIFSLFIWLRSWVCNHLNE